MSYMAKSNGYIVAKDDASAKEVSKIIEESKLYDDCYLAEQNTITVYSYNENYHEEEFYDLYEKLSPFVKKAEIVFTGEEDCLWKHECKNGVWNELSGEVVYKNPFHIAGISNQLSNSSTTVYVNLENIVDSLQIDSDTQIASYDDDENDIHLSLEVRGAVKVDYKGEYYTDPSDFPDDLKKLIKEGYTEYDENNVPTKLPFSYSPDVNVLDNNWFELFRLDKDGSPFGESWVVDCEEYTDADIDSLFEDTAANILKYEQELAEKEDTER